MTYTNCASLKARPRVLLDEQNGDAAAVDVEEAPVHVLHDDRSEALRHLVGEDEPGRGHQRAADGEHLLLAAGQAARALALPLAEAGKRLEHRLAGAGDLGTVRAEVGAHAQVLEDGHLGEDAPALGDVRDAEGGDLALGERVDPPAAEADLPRPDGHEAGDGLDEACLARAVRPDDRRDGSLRHADGGAVDRARPAVGDLDPLHLEQRRRAHPSSATPR
jgi:hypothetical protein